MRRFLPSRQFRPLRISVPARRMSNQATGALTRKDIDLTPQEQRLRDTLQNVAKYIGIRKGREKPVLRFAGGWVRDKLLGGESKDIDVAIDNMTGKDFYLFIEEYLKEPENQVECDEASLRPMGEIKKDAEKSKHLETATTRVYGLDIDLVNLRKETYADDSRNPAMEFGSAKEDALRRDATINALFFNLSAGIVEDFTGQGIQDLEAGIIRTPLEPLQTFKDDPLRVLRCIRFSSRFGYRIEESTRQVMGDSNVKEALRKKISRERVLVEVQKTLKGPRPRMALELIDNLRLYNTVFTAPQQACALQADSSDWHKSYDQLHHIISDSAPTPTQKTIKTILLRDPNEQYRAWLLCSLVPWARVENPDAKMTKKAALPMPAVVAREGLSLDNNSASIIRDACWHLDEIIAQKDAAAGIDPGMAVPAKRKQKLGRDIIGMAIRRWGRNWRSSAMFALLVQIGEATDEQGQQKLLRDYSKWLLVLQDMDLLDAYALKPILNGSQLMRALGESKGGEWIKAPIRIAMEWQLRHPDKTDADEALAEIVSIIKNEGVTEDTTGL